MLLGSDPEVFLRNATGKHISAIGNVQGTKKHPVPLKDLGKGFFMQADNVLLEFNIPPASTSSRWISYHQLALSHLSSKMKEKGLSLSIDASAVMDDDQLACPEAHIFGCEPDFNAWDLCPNPRPRCDNPNLRVAGGHVHIEFDGTDAEKVLLVRALDYSLGLWSVLADPDTERRKLYGKAGSFRFKPYGIEYRTLSNFWLQNAGLMEEVYNRVAYALKRINRNYPERIQTAINTGDKDMANDLMASI